MHSDSQRQAAIGSLEKIADNARHTNELRIWRDWAVPTCGCSKAEQRQKINPCDKYFTQSKGFIVNQYGRPNNVDDESERT